MSQGPRVFIRAKATCAAPLCEVLTPCRGQRPHHGIGHIRGGMLNGDPLHSQSAFPSRSEEHHLGSMKEYTMSFKVQVGPPQIAIHQGQTVLISEPDGQIKWPSEKGLYFLDTRIISNWAIYANGELWELLNGGPVEYHAARIFLTNKLIRSENGVITPRTLGLTLSRAIDEGLHEDIDITNNNLSQVRFQLEIAFRCDFADVFEVKSGQIVRRGQITTKWSQPRQRLRTAYSNRDFHRAVTTTVQRASSTAVSANGRLSFEVALAPHDTWHACLLYTLEDGERRLRAPQHCVGDSDKSRHSRTTAEWLKTVAKIDTSNEEFYRLFRQALEDMAALR